jgi:hypothetical protein
MALATMLASAPGFRSQRRRHVQILLDHVGGVFDIDRSRRAGLRNPQRVADNLIRLVGVFDTGAVLHRVLKQPHLFDELNPAAADALFGHAGSLAAQKDDRGVFDPRAHHRTGRVGDAGAERSDAHGRPAGHARVGFGHKADRELVMGRDHVPTALLCFDEQMHEVRVGYAEQRVDALGLKQMQDALIDFD